VHWSGYDTTALDIEVDPQRCRFGSRKSDFALQALSNNVDLLVSGFGQIYLTVTYI
jgi:hypothetical protein